MMTGHTLQECAKIMTSPFFQCDSTLSQANDIDEISRSVKSKEIMKFVAMEGEIHTINNGLLAFLRRGPIEGSANNCFLLKLLFKTDDRGRFIDSSGNIIKFEGKNDLETLNAKGVKLKYPIQFKVITPNGLEDASKMYLLEEALYNEGFSKEDIEKIFYKNFLRLLKRVCK